MSSPKRRRSGARADYLLLVKNATQIAQVCANGEQDKRGAAMNEVAIINNGAIVVSHDGMIAFVGTMDQLAERFGNDETHFASVVDANGHCILPGFVDGHTHPVFDGNRCHEFAMKLAGATYMDIHKAGGGIIFTVEHTKNSSIENLVELLKGRLDRMLKFGTTLAEAKTGYGWDTEVEMKMLKVIHQARTHSVELVSTYLPAHSVPKGRTAKDAAEDIVKNQIPELIRLKAAGEISPENIDVFYEKGIYEREDTKAVLEAGKAIGLHMNFHGDELNPMHAGEFAAELGARAVSHLEHVTDEGIKAMATHNVYAVLLPTTAYVLRITPPPARKLIEGGVPVALGSDYNPNAHCLSMPHVMNLACVMMRMTMAEALVAATINSAASLNRSRTHGSLEVGKQADFVVLHAPKWEHIIYEMVDPQIASVYKKGHCVYSRN